jgi:transmembrane sensor
MVLRLTSGVCGSDGGESTLSNADRQSEHSDTPSVADQALQWFTFLQSGDATGADRRRFRSWLGADAPHRQEFEKLSTLWADLDGVKPLLHEEINHADLDGEPAAHSGQRYRTVRRWGASWVSAALVSCLLVLVAGGYWLISPEVMEYRTAKGEQQTVALSDGSTVRLNTATALTTNISMFHRRVVLREGEAYFSVSHEQNRPFEVMAGNGVVRDVGTRFVVRREDEKVTVTVVEGTVDVQRLAKGVSTAQWQRLTAGEQVSYEPQRGPSSVGKVSLATSTAWMEGKVIFEERPLSEVVREIGRYQAGEIRILDSQVEALKVSGVFGVNDREGFLKALERAIPVKFSQVNRELIVLEQANDVSTKR